MYLQESEGIVKPYPIRQFPRIVEKHNLITPAHKYDGVRAAIHPHLLRSSSVKYSKGIRPARVPHPPVRHRFYELEHLAWRNPERSS